MRELVRRAGREADYEISSAATSTEEIGNPMHYGARAKLREKGIPLDDHRAVQLKKKDYDDYDYIIGMDRWNLRNMRRIVGADPDGRLHLLLSYTDRPGDIADPWYTGDFETAYQDILEGCEGLLKKIIREEI